MKPTTQYQRNAYRTTSQLMSRTTEMLLNVRRRYKAMILASLASFLVAMALFNADARSTVSRYWPGVACWPAAFIENMLQEKTLEQPVGYGETTNGRIQIWASRDGASFSVVANWGDNDDYRCIIAQGKGLFLDEGQLKRLLLNGESRGI